MRFVIYYFSSSCELPTFPFVSLIDTILHFVWDLYSFFFLYHCYYQRTMLPKAMLIPYWTQYEVALCYNLEYISFSHPSQSGSVFEGSGSGGNNRDNRPGIKGCPCVPANGSDAISLDLSLSEAKAAHAADSLCGNTHCRRAHMQSIPQFRSLFHLRPQPTLPPRRVDQHGEKARTGRRHG